MSDETGNWGGWALHPVSSELWSLNTLVKFMMVSFLAGSYCNVHSTCFRKALFRFLWEPNVAAIY